MSQETTSRIPEELFVKKPEEDLLPSGYVPDRWRQIVDAQNTIMKQALEEALEQRRALFTQEDYNNRETLLQKHLDSHFLAPSFENGPYAHKNWRNFYELFRQILDLETDEALMPDQDERITFYSGNLGKDRVILSWILDKIQDSLRDDEQFTEEQISNMFNNISQEQMTVLIEETVKSGLSISSKTSQERWVELVKQSSPKNNAS